MSLELMPDPSSNVAAAGAVRMRLAPQRDSDAMDERVDGKDGSANAGEFRKPSDSRGVATKGDEAEDKLLKQLGLVSVCKHSINCPLNKTNKCALTLRRGIRAGKQGIGAPVDWGNIL